MDEPVLLFAKEAALLDLLEQSIEMGLYEFVDFSERGSVWGRDAEGTFFRAHPHHERFHPLEGDRRLVALSLIFVDPLGVHA